MELIGAKPDRKVIIYFLLAIVAGTFLLWLPVSSPNQPVSFVDALFTATSAVCVTGLTVLDTGSDFTLFGQIVILVLIQLGGLGIMTFATFLLMTMIPRIPFQDRMALSNTLGGGPRVKTSSLLKAVVLTTLSFEFLGALALFFRFQGEYPFDLAVYYSVFHAVSAFCNAGFSTFSNSLENYVGDFYVLAVFSVLIICGGLGFIVIRETILCLGSKKKQAVTSHQTLFECDGDTAGGRYAGLPGGRI